MEDRSKRAETVRPLHEHCECQFVYDSALSAKSEMHDIGLNVRRMTRTRRTERLDLTTGVHQ